MNLYREAFLHIKSFSKIFWIVIFATFINQAGNMAFVFLMLYGTEHLGLSVIKASFAFIAFSLSVFISGVTIGTVIDEIGPAKVMIGSLLINAVILLVFPFVHRYEFMIGMCLAWGFVYGAYRPASQTMITHLSKPGLHKITFSVYRLVLNLGMSIGPAIAGYLAAHSFPAIFISNGIANILAGLVLIIGLYGTTWITYHAQSDHKKVISIKWLKYDPILRLLVIAMIPISMVFFQHESTLPVYLKQNLHLPMSFYGWLFTVNTLMIVFFELLLNVATIHWSYRIHFILGTFFITVGFAGMALATTGWHIIVLTMVWTVGEMILYPSLGSCIADIAPKEHRGSYMGMYNTCSNLGILLGSAGGAMVLQHLGGHALWLICAVCGIISISIFSNLKLKES